MVSGEKTSSFEVLSGTANGAGRGRDVRSQYFYAIRSLCDGLYQHQEYDVSWSGPIDDRPRATRLPGVTGATLLPVTRQENADDYAILLAKTSLYSDLAVVVLDCELDGWDTSYSASGLVRLGDHRHLDSVVELNRRYADLVRAEKCVFLPKRLEYQYGSAREDVRWDYRPPVACGSDQAPYLPLNRRSIHTDHRELFLYKHIVLPYFPNADLRRIALLRDEENDSFVRFTAFLRQRVTELAKADSTQRVDDLITEIEAEVAGLSIEARKLTKGRLLNGAQLGFSL